MTLDLDELERKAKAALWPDDTEPKTHEHFVALIAMQEAVTPSAVLALIERVRDAEAEKAADVERAEYWRVEANRVHAEALAKANERVRQLEKKLAEAPDNWENGEAFEKDINA